MKKQIGLWIDHKKAMLLSLDVDGENIQKIESGIERHVSYRGASNTRTPYSAQYQKGDDQLDNQFTVYLNKFYDKIIIQLRGAGSVLIIGPGEAKAELKKRLAHAKVRLQIVGIEPADKMTERQFAAKIRRYFKQSGMTRA